MKLILLLAVSLMLVSTASGQTCTITCGPTPCTVQWVNNPTPTCPAGGKIIIPLGVTVEFGPSDTWTGSTMEVYGQLLVTANNVEIDANIVIKDGGLLTVSGKLRIGQNTSGCGKTLVVESGGTVNVSDGGGGSDDRLSICNKAIIISPTPGNSCNTYDPNANPPTPLPYCNPPGGFQCGAEGQPTCPIEFTQGGVPIELLYFMTEKKEGKITLKWATSKEEDFSHFVIQHAVNSLDFTDLDEVPGAGYNTESVLKYSYTHTLPLIGHNYYRLKAVDLDGSFEYFGPVVERYQGTKALWVHPNPSSATKVEFRTNFTPNEGDRVQVFNPLGLLISDVPVDQAKGVVHFNEPVRAGSYILRYVSVQETTFARFVVIN
jgi:hypothetical protein